MNEININMLNVGDKVFVYGTTVQPEVRTVARVTKTQFIDSANVRWNARGRRCGEYSHRSFVRIWTPQDDIFIANQQRQQKHERDAWRIKDHQWKSESYETVEAAIALIEKATSGKDSR